ncbi:MAG: glycosyltransferase family 25 protein [Rhodobacteraceae bacterium]|nr:glycosyltransferase family 25 protein [Paracoccaceae bacterium]
MKVSCFVIHLERATDRLANVNEIMSNAPVRPQILRAVDGEQLSGQVQASEHRRHLHRPEYPFSLVQGEIGAFLSHRSSWKRIWRGDADAGLVIEDDASLDPELMKFAFRLACARINELGYIQFSVKKPRGIAEILASERFSDETFVNLSAFRTVPLGAVAQLISKKAAMRLYEVSESFDRPVDTFLQMHWLTGQPVATIYPSGVTHGSSELALNSTIHRRKGKQKWWRREWNRFHYRSALRRLSSNHLDVRQALGDRT